MTAHSRLTFLALLMLGAAVGPELFAQIDQEEFIARRHNLLSSLEGGCAVAMRSGEFKMRSNDVEYRYRQESNFLYLTGWRSNNCYILLSSNGLETDGRRANVFLFTPSAEDSAKTKLGTGEIILNSSRFQEIFNRALPGTGILYISAPDLMFVNDWLNDKKIFLDKNSKKDLEQKYPGLKVKNALPLFGKFREIKSEAEIGLMQKSIELTWNGLRRALNDCAPGRWEYELQAAIEYEMTLGGADYPAWTPIVGSGENSLTLHYDQNRARMSSGDLVVIDVGAEYDGYSCDITRTIPVSGKFTGAQKEVYQAVLSAQEEVIRMMKPGVKLRDLDSKAKESITSSGYGKFIRHGVSHPLGIDAHDIWDSDTLRAGMVMTVEPGIYIPSDAQGIPEDFRGFGIRIEDDVLVTEKGCRVLSDIVPKSIDQIEKLMKKK